MSLAVDSVTLRVERDSAVDFASLAHEAARLEPSYDLRWYPAVCEGLGWRPCAITARAQGRLVGYLPLAAQQSYVFGRFLVSLPYVNAAGVIAADADVAQAMVSRAVELADELGVRFLEQRHTADLEHPAFSGRMQSKVLMRLALPETAEAAWDRIGSKVRNQVRKGEKSNLDIAWGGGELLEEFYQVFSVNMRDLGTPVYGRRLFRSILKAFDRDAEFCVVRQGTQPIAAALLVHSAGRSEVPSASSLRAYNSTNCNMLMYWQLIRRAIERGQSVFDFGRSTVDSPTFAFKKQWGATPSASTWHYYLRHGSADSMRPQNSRFQQAIQIWQRLPVWLTQYMGPSIVRCIP